jgi:hypothetical protein
MTGTCEAECEDVEVCDGSRMIATIGLEHRVLGNGEVSVHVEI